MKMDFWNVLLWNQMVLLISSGWNETGAIHHVRWFPPRILKIWFQRQFAVSNHQTQYYGSSLLRRAAMWTDSIVCSHRATWGSLVYSKKVCHRASVRLWQVGSMIFTSRVIFSPWNSFWSRKADTLQVAQQITGNSVVSVKRNLIRRYREKERETVTVLLNGNSPCIQNLTWNLSKARNIALKSG